LEQGSRTAVVGGDRETAQAHPIRSMALTISGLHPPGRRLAGILGSGDREAGAWSEISRHGAQCCLDASMSAVLVVRPRRDRHCTLRWCRTLAALSRPGAPTGDDEVPEWVFRVNNHCEDRVQRLFHPTSARRLRPRAPWRRALHKGGTAHRRIRDPEKSARQQFRCFRFG
jgi:hypothetical protein